MSRSALVAVVGFVVVAGVVASGPGRARAREAPRGPAAAGSVVVAEGGRLACRELGPGEAAALSQAGRTAEVRPITPARRGAGGGLHIEMSGTAQLESHPDAKRAFLRAAAAWEAMIQSPVTVSLRVDYGELRFGQPFVSGFIGYTSWGLFPAAYADVRASLVAQAATESERAVLDALPAAAVPTDLGDTDVVYTPPAPLKALGLLEEEPASDADVGFNSAVAFDFDPSDGIDAGTFDFYALALHEMGHALGFDSNVGRTDLFENVAVAPTMWDLFRFREGVTAAEFSTAQRRLEPGGRQVFFAEPFTLALSTADPNGEGGRGGDRWQANHWRADELSGTYIGIMDPSLSTGTRYAVTNNDLVALDVFGYAVAVADPGGPTVSDVSFRRGKLTVRGAGLAEGLRLEINDAAVAAPVTIARSGARLRVSAAAADLGLVSGLNRVRVVASGGLRSNVFVAYVRV